MKDLRFLLAAALLVVAWTSAMAADVNSAPARPRLPLGTNPHPVIWGGQQAKPAQPTPQPQRPADRDHRDGPRHGVGRTYYVSSYCPNVSTYYDNYPYNYVYSQPWLPTGNMGGWPAARANDDVPEPKKAEQRPINSRANALAWKFIGYGDARFAEQKYSDANGRYRKAAQSAPQLADVWFRQAFALSAMGRYDQAVTAVKRGLRLDPNWAKSGFDLRELYLADDMAKDAHLDALAQAAENNPNDANLLFLVGVYLYFDEQPQRAKKFFLRARELAGDDPEHIMAFLKKPL